MEARSLRAAVVVAAVAVMLLAGPQVRAQEAGIPILGAVADVVIALDATNFVENTSLNGLPGAGGRADSCGTEPRFAIESPTRFLFHETGQASTECGELGIRFTPPVGVRAFRLEFAANRSLAPPTDQQNPASGEPARFSSNALQEVRVAGDKGVAFLTRDVFPPTSLDSPFVNITIPIELPEGGTSVNLTWYFEDKGPLTIVQGVPNAASTDTFVAAVDSPRIRIPDYPIPFGALVNETSRREGDDVVMTRLYGVATPNVDGVKEPAGLRIRLAPTANFSHILAPDGARIDATQLNRSLSMAFADVYIPPDIVAAHGNGTYSVAIVTRGPAPPAPPPPDPFSLSPLAFALVALPALPGAFATRATVSYWASANERFRGTARLIASALGAVVALYALVAAYVLLAPRWVVMESIPITPEGVILDALFGVFALALFVLWLVPSRYATRALEADLEERRRAETKFRGLLEAAPDGIVIVDANDVVVLVNRQAEKLFGHDRDEMIGRKIGTLVPTPIEGGVFAAVLRQSAGESIEMRGLRGNGTEFPIDITLSPIETEDGRLVAAAVRDITDRKRTEAELHRSNTELEHFAYIASHDLQEPLRTIAGFAQLLEARYSENLDDRGKRYIERTVAGSQRMQILINDLLAYSRVQTQGRAFARVDLNEAVDTVLTDLETILRDANARVTRDPLPVVDGDASQLGQVFSNLIRNSVKYRHPDRPPVIAMSAEREGAMWRISVRDNGIGIASEYHEKVFVIFQRLQPRGDEGGTGLGLAITKRIVERHGGRVWIESVPGQGATFHFTLPNEGGSPR